MAPREAVRREALDTQEAAAAVQREWRKGQTSAQSSWNNLPREQDRPGDSWTGKQLDRKQLCGKGGGIAGESGTEQRSLLCYSRGELHPQLCQQGGRQHIKAVRIPFVWPF